MRTQRWAIGLTMLNLFVLMSLLFRANSATTPDLPSVLRVRGLELVDDQGRVRALLKVFPADPKVRMPDGTTGYGAFVGLNQEVIFCHGADVFVCSPVFLVALC